MNTLTCLFSILTDPKFHVLYKPPFHSRSFFFLERTLTAKKILQIEVAASRNTSYPRSHNSFQSVSVKGQRRINAANNAATVVQEYQQISFESIMRYCMELPAQLKVYALQSPALPLRSVAAGRRGQQQQPYPRTSRQEEQYR